MSDVKATPSPRLDEAPWANIPPPTCERLWAAGLTDPAVIARTSIADLSKVNGVTMHQARKVRAAIPADHDRVGTAVATRAGPDGGVLLSGGKGRGRMREEVRDACREAFAGQVGPLEAMASDTTLPPRWRLRAIDMLAKYGLGTRPEKDREGTGIEPGDVTATIQALGDATTEWAKGLRGPATDDDMDRLYRTWFAILGERLPSLMGTPPA